MLAIHDTHTSLSHRLGGLRLLCMHVQQKGWALSARPTAGPQQHIWDPIYWLESANDNHPITCICLCFDICCRGYCKVAGRSAGPIAVKLASLEASAAEYMIQLSSRAATELGIWALAVLSLAHRALRGQRFTTSAWTILSLWLLLLISELRVFNQVGALLLGLMDGTVCFFVSCA